METTIGQEGAARRLAQRSRRIGFLGAELDLASSAEVLEQAAASLATRRPIQISALNVAKLVALRNDPAFRRHVIDSDLVIADGMGIVLGARLLGHRVAERVTGIDLFQALLALCERRGHRVFLLGATAAVLAAAVAEIRRRHPDLQIAGARHGYFTPAEAPAIVDEINRVQADCLFVAMSSPAKERFLADHGARLAVTLQMGIGGSLDVVAGCKRRAPGWMQAVGLEWLWRTLLEPRRLFWRYFSTNWAYAGLLLRAMLAGDGSAPAGSPARPRPARVLQVYGGGLRLEGGISRNLGYLLDASKDCPDLPQHIVIDPRGGAPVPLGPWAVLAPLHLGRALAAGAWLVASREVDLMHLHMTVGGSTLRKAPFILLARLLGKPVVLHLHGGRYAAQYASWPWARRALARASFRAADRVIVLGPRMRAFVAGELEVPQAAIVDLPNAVAGPLVAPERAAGDVCRIAFVGALHQPKGLGDLLDALGDRRLRARRWRLSVLGNGDRELWSARAASLGIGERVRFTGWLTPAEVSSVLAATDLFVLPSHGEGMSLAVLEAMAHGCAIVTTPVGEHLDVIDHGADGMLVPPGEVAALASALLGLIDSPAERARLGRAARARYERCHTIERYVVRLAGIYRELLSPSSQSGPACSAERDDQGR